MLETTADSSGYESQNAVITQYLLKRSSDYRQTVSVCARELVVSDVIVASRIGYVVIFFSH